MSSSGWGRLSVTLTLGILGFAGGARSAEPAPDMRGLEFSVKPFFDRYCVECHGPQVQKASVQVDTLQPIGQGSSGEKWQEILDVIELEEMPPAKELQPSGEDRQVVSDWIRTEIARAEAAEASTGGKVVLRRLNRNEYAETLRQLLQIPDSVDPSAMLPADATHEGFDNVGSVMNVSARLLEIYLDTAEEMLRIALPAEAPPEPVAVTIEGEAITQEWLDENYRRKRQAAKMFQELKGLDRSTKEYQERRQEIRNLGRSHQDKLPRESLIFSREDNGLASDGEGLIFRDGVFLKTGRVRYGGKGEGVYAATLRLRGVPGSEGQAPLVNITFETALKKHSVWSGTLGEEPEQVTAQIWLESAPQWVRVEIYGAPDKPGPEDTGVWIDSLTLEGPINPWPTPAYTSIFGEEPEESDAERIIRDFTQVAFRRPVSEERLSQFVDFYRERRKEQSDFEAAVKDTLVAVLVAPEFLFLLEPKAPDSAPEPLDDFELASRLSYFLWGGPPDEELYSVAAEGRLQDPDVLREQTGRMLMDDRAIRFAENFAGQWLNLRELGGAMVPDPKRYPEYDDTIQEAMLAETKQYFLHVLRNGLPIRTLLKSDFTFLNEPLANLYGVPDVHGEEMRLVKLEPEAMRGGLLTQGAILTVTSDGVRTSPVKRGTFILEQILGDPPPPPPPDVPPVPEPEGDTLKERLKSHRQLEACSGCHNKIDPLGFALENFNAIGKWRENEEDTKLPIDPSGTLKGGIDFEGYADFIDLLVGQEEAFQHCLAEKMMIYALGRPIDFSDASTIEAIVDETNRNGGTLAHMVLAIVNSQPFRTK